MAGKFVVLEGMDGTGKTTQAERLIARLNQLGRNPVHLREPGTTSLGEQLRSILLDSERKPICPRTEALLFFASRNEMLKEEVLPALESGQDVICERFTPSTVAYQGLDEDLRGFVLALDQLVVAKDLSPDAVLILDLPAEVSLARATDRSEADNFEARGLAFQNQVRNGYRAYENARPEHTFRIPVEDQNPDQVEVLIQSAIGHLWSND